MKRSTFQKNIRKSFTRRRLSRINSQRFYSNIGTSVMGIIRHWQGGISIGIDAKPRKILGTFFNKKKTCFTKIARVKKINKKADLKLKPEKGRRENNFFLPKWKGLEDSDKKSSTKKKNLYESWKERPFNQDLRHWSFVLQWQLLPFALPTPTLFPSPYFSKLFLLPSLSSSPAAFSRSH